MLVTGSMIKIWYHCRFKRKMHGTSLYSRNFYYKPLGVLARFPRLLAKLTGKHYVHKQ